MFKVEIDQVPQRRLAALLHQGAYAEISGSFAKLTTMASTQNLWPRVRGMVGVHYDDPNITKEADLRSHAGLIIADSNP